MKKHSAFTMIELVFVIVVMGIIGKFGVEFLVQSYKSFIFSSINNSLQEKSAFSVEFLASRLQYRVKDSVIAREEKNDNNYTAIGNVDNKTYKVLEWIQSDIDGFRGLNEPYWSALADIDKGDKSTIYSPKTDTSLLNLQIQSLSYNTVGVDASAIYFIGSNNDIDGYGWKGGAFSDQSGVMHRIEDGADTSTFYSKDDNFTNVYEYYKLSWTANAVVIENYDTEKGMGDLFFYYNYQPWNGQHIKDTPANLKRVLLMENVSTFKFLSIGSILKIQICTKSDLVEEYSLCKEKTIF